MKIAFLEKYFAFFKNYYISDEQYYITRYLHKIIWLFLCYRRDTAYVITYFLSKHKHLQILIICFLRLLF